MIEESREVVGPRADLHVPMRLGVLQRDRDLGGEQLHQLELVARERFDIRRAREREHSRDAVTAPKRHEDPARRRIGGRRHGLVPVIGAGGNQPRLVVADDPCRKFAVHRGMWIGLAVGTLRRQWHQGSGPRVAHLDGERVVPDEPAQPIRDLVQDRSRIEGREDRLRDVEQLALAPKLPLEGGRLRPQALVHVGVRHGLGGDARVALEQAEVVVAELVEAAAGERDDPQHPVLEDEWRQEQRLVERFGPRDVLGSGIDRGIRQVLGDAVGRHPARDPFADPASDEIRRLVEVDLVGRMEGDGDQVLTVEPVDTDVVVVDEAAQLRGHRGGDLGDRGQAGEAGAELVDRLQLGGPASEVRVLLGGPDRDGGLRREGRHRLEVGGRPGPGPVMTEIQHPDRIIAVEERRGADRVEALLHHGRPERPASHVVAVGRHEQRPALVDCIRRKGGRRGVTDRGEVRGRQTARQLRDDAAVRLADDDAGAIRREHDHRVVHDPAQRLVEVEAPARVHGDLSQRFGTMQGGRRRVQLRRRPDGRSEQGSRRLQPGHGLIAGGERRQPDRDGAPRPLGQDRDGHVHRESAGSVIARAGERPERDDRDALERRCSIGRVRLRLHDRPALGDGLRRDRGVGRTAAVGCGADGSSPQEPVVAQLPECEIRRPGRIAEQSGGVVEDRVQRPPVRGEARKLGEVADAGRRGWRRVRMARHGTQPGAARAGG